MAAALYHDESASIRESAKANQANVARVLSNVIQSLTALRESLLGEEESAAEDRINEAYQRGMQWLRERLGADWLTEEVGKIEVPSFGDRIGQTFLGSWVKPDSKKQ